MPTVRDQPMTRRELRNMRSEARIPAHANVMAHRSRGAQRQLGGPIVVADRSGPSMMAGSRRVIRPGGIRRTSLYVPSCGLSRAGRRSVRPV